MLRSLLVVALAVICSSQLMAPRANAAPQPFGSNFYEFIQVANPYTDGNNAWTTARDAAAARTFNGASGHLATVSSAAENSFLFSLAGSFSGFTGSWLGGKSPEGWLVGPEAGHPFTYVNWGGSEPNSAGYAYMNIGTSFAGIGPGQWADIGVGVLPSPGSDPIIGYFVEYEGAAMVPEPASWLLLLVGALPLIRRRLR